MQRLYKYKFQHSLAEMKATPEAKRYMQLLEAASLCVMTVLSGLQSDHSVLLLAVAESPAIYV